MPILFSVLVIFGFLTLAASALAINSKTHLSLAFNSTAPFITSASPSINSTITPQGALTNQQTFVSTLTPIANGVVELWDVTASKSIGTATTNNDGKYQAVLKIICNKNFNIEARFAGTSDYLPETSYQVTVTPTGGSQCASGQDPYQVVSTAPPTATGSSGSSKDYVPLVQIPGIPAGADFLGYLKGIYNFLISIVGILAMASLVYGGFRYLTSVGNPAAVEDAKDIINSAIIGLVLALSSWLILNEINPDVLVTNKKPGITGQTWPGYKYGQTPSTRACVADTNIEGVPVPNDTTKKKCRCVDDPTRDVTFTPSAVTGPYVVSTTPTACATRNTGVPTTTPYAIIINYSEPMDPATILTPGSITVSPAVTGTPSMPSPTQVRLDLTTALAGLTEYTVTVVGGGAFNKNTAGVAMQNNYVFRFTTTFNFTSGCTPQAIPVTTCGDACSNPNALNLNPAGYHCLKADLRVGNNLDNMSSDKISINAGQKLYFDMSNSKDYLGNPIARYEINWNGSPLWGVFGDFTCCPITFITKCLGWPTLCPITSDCPTAPPLVTDHTYTTAGTYTVWYSVHNDKCDTTTNPQAIFVDVK